MKRVLVTGSEGNIGSFAVRSLSARYPDATIVRVSRRQAPGVIAGDLRDRGFVRSLFDAPADAVVHAAAMPYGPDMFKKPFSLLDTDLALALNLLEAAAEAGAGRFVLLSSATVYEKSATAPFAEESTETSPPPSSPLALAKLAAERAVRAWSEETGAAHAIWRLHNVVSPAEPHDRPGHVYVDLYRKIFVDRAPRIELFGDGRQLRCYTWVEDVADAFAEFLEDGRAANQTFNLGSDEPRSVRELAEELVAAGKRHGVLPESYAPEIVASGTASAAPDQQARVPSVAKASELLGWRPRTSFSACIEKFIAEKQRHAH